MIFIILLSFTCLSSVWNETKKILASDGDEDDCFGISVSIDGDYTLVGSYYDDDNGENSGSAYIFQREGSNWVEKAKLLASDGDEDDMFGLSVSLDGDYALIGAFRDEDNGYLSGSAYVFHRVGGVWVEQAKLLPSDGNEGDKFAYDVSISGDYALIGAKEKDYCGSAYIFQRIGDEWIEIQKLLASDGDSGDSFGASVSIDGDYALIGNYRDYDNGPISGSAYIFQREGSNWVEKAKLLASDGEFHDYFSIGVSISGDYALIGADSDDDNGEDSGSAYIYHKEGTDWIEQAKLLPSDGDSGDYFGYSVSIDGDYAFIASYCDNDNGENSGSVYVFQRENTIWHEYCKLLPSDGSQYEYFGMSVSIDDSNAVIGSHYDSDNGFCAGSAYIFEIADTPPEVTNVTGSQRYDGSFLVDIYYDVYDVDGDLLTISMEVSDSPVGPWNIACNEVTGDLGGNIDSGNGKHIIWDIGTEHPDTELEVLIKIIADDNNTSGYGLSGDFWIITTFDRREISFRPDPDGWLFGNADSSDVAPYNDEPIMWPEFWWSQFDYSSEEYPPGWSLFSSERFPDWPLFEEVFGEDQCYYNSLPGVQKRNPIAALLWIDISRAKKDSSGQPKYWDGSCFGFSLSSAQYYCHEEEFRSKFSDLGDFEDLYSIDIPDNSDSSNVRRKCINHCYIQQYGAQHKLYLNSVKNKTPNETVVEIKEMFLYSESDLSTLTMCENNGKSRHSVNPWRVDIFADSANIYVYDNNYKGSNTKQIRIDLVNDTWDYTEWMEGYEGSTGLFLREPCGEYFNTPKLNLSSFRERNDYLDLYCVSDADIVLQNSIGETLSCSESGIINNLSDGIPIIPENSVHSEPIGYFIPKDNYTVNASNFEDSSAYYVFLSDSTYYYYHRDDANETQNDVIEFSDQQKRISVINEDSIEKSGNFEICFVSDSESEMITVSDFYLTESDSLAMQIQGDSYNIINKGTPKTYDLKVNYRSADTDSTLEHFSLELENNCSHILEPDWEDLSEVEIYVDEGIDGSIDDTLYVENQVVPIAPSNVIISKAGGFLQLSWDVVPGCTYRVYSSDNIYLPYDMWELEVEGLETNSWETPFTEDGKRYFYIKAVNLD